jgi:hypothetical protein
LRNEVACSKNPKEKSVVTSPTDRTRIKDGRWLLIVVDKIIYNEKEAERDTDQEEIFSANT